MRHITRNDNPRFTLCNEYAGDLETVTVAEVPASRLTAYDCPWCRGGYAAMQPTEADPGDCLDLLEPESNTELAQAAGYLFDL